MWNSLSVAIQTRNDSKESVETLGLIDSGAGGEFIDQNFAKKVGFKLQKLEEPLLALNVDGTENKKGKITLFVEMELTINQRTTKTKLLVTGLGKQKIILGFPWLKKHNPIINWITGRFAWRSNDASTKRYTKALKSLVQKPRQKESSRVSLQEEQDRDGWMNRTINKSENEEILVAYLEEIEERIEVWINTKTSNSIEFHLQHDEKKEDLSLDEQIPVKYHEYLDVFDEGKADRFPES